jgi:hypothetical protein
MRAPLAPFKGMQKKQRTIEDVLTAFVEATSSDTCQEFARNYDHKIQAGKAHTQRVQVSLALSRPVLETALQDMIGTFAVSFLKTSIIPSTDKTTVAWRTNRNLVESVCRTHSTKDLPKMILFYIHFLRRNNSNKVTNASRDTVFSTIVLNKLVSYLFHNTVGILSTRQRQHIKILLNSLSTMNEKRSETTHQHHNQQNEEEPFLCVKIEGPHNALADDIDESKIIFHLRVLKKGGYWQHLPREDGEHHHDEEHHLDHGNDPVRSTRVEAVTVSSTVACDDVEKENASRLGNRKQTSPHFWQNENDHEDDEIDYEDEDEEAIDDENDTVDRVFICCVLISPRDGIVVHKVTKDGWWVSSPLVNGEDSYLLRLPSKLASLGRDGMKLFGIDLMKRRDNGVLEPCCSSGRESCHM